jgi:pyrrolysyl-tRNA synthetase-like protein
MSPEIPLKRPAVRYYRKRVELFLLLDKIKLWPSRQGKLHGIKTLKVMGDVAQVTTHCGKTFLASNSRNSRAARWLRNKWFKQTCTSCGIPNWKLEKYASTGFRRHQGSMLKAPDSAPPAS